MPRWAKLLMGLAASLAAGLVHHGPLGGGERFVASLEAQAKLQTDYVGTIGLPGIRVRIQRDPLARVAILSGRADLHQREGTSLDPARHRDTDYPGINDRIRAIAGVASVRWEE
ncbi:hypothetical protein [Allosphingosinicella sp.]|jgi:hypothetical protein|uniref:hypothetical protein n=1 Tax=Allosphingosinicella sp. TaxID=2823234 RepID=UPI002EF1384B